MKQDLEKYLKKNRLKLDAERPEADVIWEGIRSGMDKKAKFSLSWLWKVAAIFIFIISATYFIINEIKTKQITIVSLADVSEDLGKQEAELKLIVDRKWEEIKPLLPKEKANLQFLLDELNELDKNYKTYEEDLSETGVNEYIITALLDYYEKKIKILSRLALEIEKQKNHETIITI